MSNSALMKWPKLSPLSSLIKAGEVTLGRGDVISNIDINSFPGKYPIYSSSSKNEGRMGAYGKYMFNEELISWSVDGGGYLFYRPKHKFSVTNVSGFMRLNERWDYKFVAYCLQLQHSYLTFDYQTKAHPSVIKELYSLPEIGRSEQKAIANILDTLDTQIRQTEAIIAKLQQVKQGLLHDLLTRGIDTNGQLRPPRDQAPELYKESPLGWVPKEWEVSDLSEAVDFFSGGTPSKSKEKWWSGDVPLLTPKDMKSFELFDTIDKVSEQAAHLGSRLMPAETVFIVVRGMILAHTFPVVLSKRRMAFNQDVKALRGNESLSQEFLAYWFLAQSNNFLRKVTESTHGTKKLDTSELLKAPIGIPSKEEQESIVKRLEEISSSIDLYSSEQQKLKKQKSGLMDDLLTGRVRVTSLLDTAKAS